MLTQVGLLSLRRGRRGAAPLPPPPSAMSWSDEASSWDALADVLAPLPAPDAYETRAAAWETLTNWS